MKEFALIFRLNEMSGFQPSLAHLQERMNWLADIAAQQHLLDKGHTLLPRAENAKVVRSNQVVTDGAYQASNEFISGYLLIKAATIDEAVTIAKTNPIFAQVDGSIEVRELLKRD